MIVEGRGSRAPSFARVATFGLMAVGALALAATGFAPADTVALVVAASTVLAVAHRFLLEWTRLVSLFVIVILFIPIRGYTIGAHLGFELEPYRALVAFLIALWITSLLISPEVRIRSGGIGMPVLLIVLSTLASIIANTERVASTNQFVVKTLMSLVVFLAFVYIVMSVVRGREAVDLILRVLVGGGAIVSVFALIESRTGFNLFRHLQELIPGLKVGSVDLQADRGGEHRAYGSAGHPIELSAMLTMLVPLAGYLRIRTGRNIWIGAAALLAMAAASTVSRTGIVMLGAILIVFLILRRKATLRLWPLLIPLLVAIQLSSPGTLGAVGKAFFPEQGLIGEQQQGAGTGGSGRVADLAPSLREWWQEPLFGQGYGTRITLAGPHKNALILDDQWLGTLLEVGLLGTVGWAWLLTASAVRFGRAARRDRSDLGWLMTALCASITAFMVSMVTFDAFSFFQVTFIALLLIALGASLLSSNEGLALDALSGEKARPLAVDSQTGSL